MCGIGNVGGTLTAMLGAAGEQRGWGGLAVVALVAGARGWQEGRGDHGAAGWFWAALEEPSAVRVATVAAVPLRAAGGG